MSRRTEPPGFVQPQGRGDLGGRVRGRSGRAQRGSDQLEAAVPAGADPRSYARALARMHEAVVAEGRPPAGPRRVIGDSWRRMLRLGLDPDRGCSARPLAADQLERRRWESGLATALPMLREGLASLAEEAAHIMVIVDADGQILWRDGASAVRRNADDLGFVEGMCWHEQVVGTNAIGTTLVEGRPVQVYSAEHYVRTHHPWTCAAAPLHDPKSGQLLGAVDLSGPAATVNATTLALVDTVARLAESQLRHRHLAELERLRSLAVPTLSKVSGRAVVLDENGWVAAASGVAPAERIGLNGTAAPGKAWLPALGSCVLEPLPGGWLVRLTDEEGAAPSTTVRLAVHPSGAGEVAVSGSGGAWTRPLSPRHAEMLWVLATHREGRSAAELARDLFGDAERTVTVRAEMSRLRRQLGGLLARRPYRFADDIEVSLCSGSPGVGSGAASPELGAPELASAEFGSAERGSPEFQSPEFQSPESASRAAASREAGPRESELRVESGRWPPPDRP